MADDHYDRHDVDYDSQGRTYVMSDRNSDYTPTSTGYKGVLLCATFVLEVIILSFVVILEYFLRWTDIFPLRRQNFSCTDPLLSCTEQDVPLMSDFAFNAKVPNEAVYALSFCVPPFVILIGEIGMFTFTAEPQKIVHVMSRHCALPQVCRRLVRFVGVFVFGGFALMIFVDIIKIMIGRLRPNFLELCQVNSTGCNQSYGALSGDEMCLNTDKYAIREGRTSFPSMNAALTSFASVFIAIYIHGAMHAHSVRIIRPFLSLVFVMLSLMCGLAEIALCQSYWTDVVVGYGMGVVLAIYLGVTILNNFRENLSHWKLLHIINSVVAENYYPYEDKYNMKRPIDYPSLHIPRAHMHHRLSNDSCDSKYRRRPYNTFQKDLAHSVENYNRQNSYLQGTSSHM
ncbi:phospholipid phosphatase-related protein type 5-like [Gigantopelta aegis]|uniref:phospholipid phosphatase-related protein type 5-like n=1 Tax=Gigantopelta aegis TaxID=1735272 RepID=UPI001B888EE0|nr:phospholipid phosphatase-related protein type 5-like [Gigantopelta aegis]XP_041356720.1 phospholipid phosphatase-related protein type 5-like [Gigantopelta aegis]